MTLRHTFCHRSRVSIGVLMVLFLASLLSLQSCKGADVVGSLASLVLTTPREPTAPADSSVLNARVKQALHDSPVTRSTDIGVDSQNGVVLLSGMVQDQTQLDLAVFVAQNVPGVSQVDSFMFSTGSKLTSPTSSSYIPAPDLVRPQRVARRPRSGEPVVMEGPIMVAPAVAAGSEENTAVAPHQRESRYQQRVAWSRWPMAFWGSATSTTNC